MVSKARLDLPDPDSPVNTISESLGNSSDTSLRLCSRAPRTTRRSATSVCFPGHESLTRTGDTSSYPGVLTKPGTQTPRAPCPQPPPETTAHRPRFPEIPCPSQTAMRCG